MGPLKRLRAPEALWKSSRGGRAGTAPRKHCPAPRGRAAALPASSDLWAKPSHTPPCLILDSKLLGVSSTTGEPAP
jgi:hypothetical protein